MPQPIRNAAQEQNSYFQRYILSTLKTGEGVIHLIEEAESAIQTAEEGKPEMEEATAQLDYQLRLSTEQYYLQELTGEWSLFVGGPAAHMTYLDMLRWNFSAFTKSVGMRNKIVEKAQLVKYLGERMQELVEVAAMEEVGLEEIGFKGDDLEKLVALGDRIDVAERDLAAVYDEVAEILKQARETGASLFDRNGAEEVQAAPDGTGMTNEKVIEITEKDIERLRQEVQRYEEGSCTGFGALLIPRHHEGSP